MIFKILIFFLSDGERSELVASPVLGLCAVEQVDEAADQGAEGQVQAAHRRMRLQTSRERGGN